jgi:hypothetical protein
MTVKDVSDRGGGKIAVRTLNNWRQSGNGPPFVKIGGSILYKLSELLQWEDLRTARSTSQYKR